MPEQAPSGPGPLIWVVILLAAIAGGVWGLPVGIAVFVGITILFVFIGFVLEKTQKSPGQRRIQQINDEYRRKHGEDLPPLTDEMRGVFDRMTGRQSQPSREDASTTQLHSHLPSHLVPPPGHELMVETALADMRQAINATPDLRSKLTVFVTRCFDNAFHCDPKAWGVRQAREEASSVFSGIVAGDSMTQLHEVAEEAVLLGYRAATPLDLFATMGQKPNDSWKPELQALVGRGKGCAKSVG